jgi:hypothetical protein
MSVTTGPAIIKSDVTLHKAVRHDGGGWSVTWLPGRILSPAQAAAAISLADDVAQRGYELNNPLSPRWARIDRWAAELGMTGIVAKSEVDMTPMQRAAKYPAAPAPIKFLVTTHEMGDRTRVNISAHDVEAGIAPFNVGGMTVDVRGGRSRADANQYFTEIIAAVHAELAADVDAEAVR